MHASAATSDLVIHKIIRHSHPESRSLESRTRDSANPAANPEPANPDPNPEPQIPTPEFRLPSQLTGLAGANRVSSGAASRGPL